MLDWVLHKIYYCYFMNHTLRINGAPTELININLEQFFQAVDVVGEFLANNINLSSREINAVEAALNRSQLICY
jgi:hypothetical protein